VKFICKICGNELDLHKVQLVFEDKKLVCKKAICCEQYMSQVRTEEYKGLPKIKRDSSDTNHSSVFYDSDKRWSKAKKNLLDGNFLENTKD